MKSMHLQERCLTVHTHCHYQDYKALQALSVQIIFRTFQNLNM